jgi:hypothetical protein
MQMNRFQPGRTGARRLITAVSACALLLAAPMLPTAADLPPSGGDFTLRRSTIDAGGGEGLGGEFVLRGTIGQHDTETMAGSEFTLRGGFWTPAGPSDFLFSDGFES